MSRSLPALIVGFLVIFAAGCTEDLARKPLKQLYTPYYSGPPPVEAATISIGKIPERFVAAFRANHSPFLVSQGFVLGFSLAVMLLTAFDFRRPGNPRNVDLLLMQAVGWSFYNILGFLDSLQDSTTRNYMDWVFTAVVVLSLILMGRGLLRIYRPAGTAWRPRLGAEMAMAIALAAIAADVATALYRAPDDAGYFVNIGAQRLRERHKLPYGDPLLAATPAAAYGPLLYLAHLPFQLALAPTPVNPKSLTRPPIETEDIYFEPPILATKLCAIAFHLLGVIALFVATRSLTDSATAWTLVALYSSSAFVLGVGAAGYSIGGITFVSHIAPAAVTLLAFALLPSPAWSGAMLAAGIGVLFYPVFMVPAWLGYYWTSRERMKRFLVGFSLTSLIIGGGVLALSQPAHDRGLIGTIVYDTIGHQESPEAYGSSPFGFWGQRTGVRGWLMTPLAADQSMTRPVVLVFFVGAALMFFLAQHKTPAQFALMIAAIAMGAGLWKIHATATYVTWYYPFLLVGFLCDRARPGERLT